jgi:cyclic pyranopterin phosphate synthase
MTHPALKDRHGRIMRKLRISLLDACNMRCVYCMPEHPHFLPQKDWATAGELTAIARNLCALGIEEIRLTGGEPTLRPDMMAIVEGLSALPLSKFGLTSNGLLLGPYLDRLKKTRCQYLNISLDSLDRVNFQRITRNTGFDKVLSAILRARDLGFTVKVNAVALRGLNDHEVLDFVDWSGRERIAVRFLEAMNIGVMQAEFVKRLVPAAEMITQIRKSYHLTPQAGPADATAYTFKADNGADIGFIASETQPFCGTCSRLRLTPQGHLRPCLFKETALASLLEMKPVGRPHNVAQPMHQIGG